MSGIRDDDHALRERRRSAAVGVVLAAFRLVKACMIHDDENHTVQQLVPEIANSVNEYCDAYAAASVRLMFSGEVAFVNRRLMRANRETYAIALQLGELLSRGNANEVTFEQGMDARSGLAFARLLVDAQRSPEAAAQLTSREIRGVVVRRVPDADELEEEKRDSPVAQVVKAYAAAVLILQGFYRSLSHTGMGNVQSVKRISQKLVALCERHPELMVAAAAAPLADANPARQAVSSAVLSIAMARRLSADRALATTAAQSALLLDLGKTLAPSSTNGKLHSGTALSFLVQTGGLHAPSQRRSTVVHQILSGDDRQKEHAVLLSRLVGIAARFNMLRAPGAKGAPGLDDTIATLSAELRSESDARLVRVFVGALGLIPAGTVVELDSGELGMVIGAPRQALDFTRPRVRLLTDSAQQALPTPLDVDLARPKKDEPDRVVRRAIVKPAS